MALGLGDLRPNRGLDDFLVKEGYERKARLYHDVLSCWCGSPSLGGIGNNNDIYSQYLLCRSCGCLILKHLLPQSDLSELYGSVYFNEHQKAIGLPPFYKRYETDALDRIPLWIAILKKYITKGRILEVGSSHGRFIKELCNSGFDAVGLELDAQMCAWAAKTTGCDIRQAVIKELKGEFFDIIFANDVMEHLYDPLGFVDDALSLLKPGGRTFFQTVVFDSWEECSVSMLRPLFHTVLYSRTSLKHMSGDSYRFLHDEQGAFGSSFVVFERL